MFVECQPKAMDVAILQEEDGMTGVYHMNCALSGEFRCSDSQTAAPLCTRWGSVAAVLTFVTFSSTNWISLTLYLKFLFLSSHFWLTVQLKSWGFGWSLPRGSCVGLNFQFFVFQFTRKSSPRPALHARVVRSRRRQSVQTWRAILPGLLEPGT